MTTSPALRSAYKAPANEGKEWHTKSTKDLVTRVREAHKKKKITFDQAHKEMMKRGIGPNQIGKHLKEDDISTDPDESSVDPKENPKGGKTLTGKPRDHVELSPQTQSQPQNVNGPTVRNGPAN